MPSSGVNKPLALSDKLQDNFLFSVTKGLHSDFPSFIEGENTLSISYIVDRMYEGFRHYGLQKLDKRHLATTNVESLNAHELDDRMRYLGIPNMFKDNAREKKERSLDWWKNLRGNGDTGTVKSVIYSLIGSGAFYDYDTETGKADIGKTSRITFTLPVGLSTWGDYPSSENIQWSGAAQNTPKGYWSSFEDLGKAELDIKVYYRKLQDYYYWKQQSTKAELYYLINEVKPLGLVYTITDVYDGTLNATSTTGNPNLVLWYELDRAVSDKTGTYTPTATNITFQSGLGSNTARFNGTTSLITTTSADVMHTEGSVFSWFYVDEQDADQYLFVFDNNDDYIFHQSGTGIVYKIEGGSEQTYSGTTSVTGVWNFVGMQWDGTNYEYIYNNSIFASGTDAGKTTTTATLLLGNSDTSNDALKGNIRNFRIYDRKLERAEWLELYSGISQFV
jgi:hypothetical protein